MLFCALFNAAFPARTAVWILQEESKPSDVNSNRHQVWFECVFPVEEHAVLEGILSGRPGSPQSCTGAGLPLDGDGWVTLPSHGRGAPGCRAASGWKWTQSTVWSGVSIVYDPRTLALSSRADGFTFESKGPGGVFCGEAAVQGPKKGLKLLMIPEKYALKKKKKVYFLLVFFFFFSSNSSVDDNHLMHWERIFKCFLKNWY